MRLAPRQIAALAGAGALALLLGAFAFQHLGGLSPCPMCLWQRWPHAVGAGLGLAAVLGGPLIIWAGLGATTMGVSAGLALYHSGVERGWWPGPSTCSAGDIGGLTPEELMAQIMAAPLVRCDEIAWSLLGLSMPNWNGLVSLALLALWAAVLIRTLRPV